MMRRRIAEEEIESVISFGHNLPCGGYFGFRKIAEKVCKVTFIGLFLLRTLLNSARHVHDNNK